MCASRLAVWACVCFSMSLGCICGTAPLGTSRPAVSGGDDAGSIDVTGLVAPFSSEQACRSIASEAVLSFRPIDIIMVIDNSGSMTAEIQAVQDNINVNFAQILDASGIDYRVIVVAKHGLNSDESVCISAPLSQTDCDPVPAKPAFGQRFFQYDVEVGSNNSLSTLLSSYDTPNALNPEGWSKWIRAESLKTFIEISDDGSAMTADQFEAALYAKQPAGVFGDGLQRNYLLHSIIGIIENLPRDAPWLPTAPLTLIPCSTAIDPGARYQELSIRTGGLRFPICQTSSYDVVFRAAAQIAIQSARVSCDFTPPAPPAGARYDQAYVVYAPGNGGAVEYFLPVTDASSCSATGFLRDPTGDRITLCSEACARVRGDAAAELTVLYSCSTSSP
jgi:hypothetical protein